MPSCRISIALFTVLLLAACASKQPGGQHVTSSSSVESVMSAASSSSEMGEPLASLPPEVLEIVRGADILHVPLFARNVGYLYLLTKEGIKLIKEIGEEVSISRLNPEGFFIYNNIVGSSRNRVGSNLKFSATAREEV